MTGTDADECRSTGVWPGRRITPLEPASPPPPRRLRRPSRIRRTLEIAWSLIVALVLLGAAGGIVYVLATGQT
jgi:hypothetical protein